MNHRPEANRFVSVKVELVLRIWFLKRPIHAALATARQISFSRVVSKLCTIQTPQVDQGEDIAEEDPVSVCATPSGDKSEIF